MFPGSDSTYNLDVSLETIRCQIADTGIEIKQTLEITVISLCALVKDLLEEFDQQVHDSIGSDFTYNLDVSLETIRCQIAVTPDVIKISEAKKSPNKKRVSISGVVAWASECRGGKRNVREYGGGWGRSKGFVVGELGK